MNADEFDKVLKTTLARTEDILGKKAGEYATDNDRLHNFKNAAVLRGSNEAQALGGMMVKHTISIYDMINSGKSYSPEMWDEKITDHINYLVLLRAIVEEAEGKPSESIDTEAEAEPSVKIVPFKTKHEAEVALRLLEDHIAQRGFTTVADLYAVAGLTVQADNLSDIRWGWENLSTVSVIRERTGYSLQMPIPKSLHPIHTATVD